MKSFRSLTALAVLLLVAPLAACSTTQTDMAFPQAGSLDSSAEFRGEMAAPFDGTVVTDGVLGTNGAIGASTPDSKERSIVRSGSVDLTVDSTAEATVEVAKVAEDLGGTVLSQQLWNDGGSTQSGSVFISVASDRFDEAFDALAKLGTVRGEQRSSDDVTEQHVDLTARVAALTISVERLKELLTGATSTSDLLEIETTLSARQAELDGLTAQLKSLEGLISEARISVSLSEQSVLPGGGPKNFWEAIGAGIASIGAFAASAVIVLGVALPWLVIAGVIAAAIVVPLRVRRKRRIEAGQPESSEKTRTTESVAESQID